VTRRVSRADVSTFNVMCCALAVVGVSTAYFGATRFTMASGVIVAYLAMCVGVLRAHRQRSLPIAYGATTHDETYATGTLIAYASQTGFAEQLAVQTATLLSRADHVVHVEPLDALSLETLARYRRALFIVSTTGEGDAPDHATSFVRNVMCANATASLRGLRYGVLALGDRSYHDFCAFGHALDRWLRNHHAEPLFDLIEVNEGDPAALRSWQTCVSSPTASIENDTLVPGAPTRWILNSRTLLNPGSAGEPAFHVCLEPADPAALSWQAGDIAEIRPAHPEVVVRRWIQRLSVREDVVVECDGERKTFFEAIATRVLPAIVDPLSGQSPQTILDSLDPLPSRQYSISSLPADGQLELLVRQSRYRDASSRDGVGLGLASGWLTQHAARGASISVWLRTNRSFHPPSDDRPLILIGAGTGLAGLRAHLKLRAVRGHYRNWLIVGERSAAHDAFHSHELAQWKSEGVLQRLDQAWSRDGGECRYVHDAMRSAAEHLQQWVQDGASIYVCGSMQRMAQTVHAALIDVLGEAQLVGLREAGRYRRDVY